MRDNKFLLYGKNDALKTFLEEKAIPYLNFRYNTNYELLVCSNYKSVFKNLDSEESRIDFLCFHLTNQKEMNIYTKIKKEYSELPVLLCAYSKVDQDLYFRPGLFPEELVTSNKKSYSSVEEIEETELALSNIKEYLDYKQPDEIEDYRKSIQSKPQGSMTYFINGEEIICIESVLLSGKSYQKVKTTRGEYISKQSISSLEKIYSTMLYRCRRDALIKKDLITGYDSSNNEVILTSGEDVYQIKVSRDKFKEIMEAYKVFFKDLSPKKKGSVKNN